MAARFWVGGPGNYNDTAHWGITSGGAGGASVPTSADTATFDMLSSTTAYTVTLTATATCSDLTVGNPLTGAVTFAGSSALDIYGSLSYAAGINLTHTGLTTFRATSGTKTIATNGNTILGNITFNGSGGTFQLTTPLTCSGATLTRIVGTFSANGQLVTLTNPNVTLSGSWLSGANFASLTIVPTAVKTCTATLTSFTCTGTFTYLATDSVNRPQLRGNATVGIVSTITSAAFNINGIDLRDITKAGAGSGNLSAASNYSGDCGGNSGWTFTTAATQTWSGTSGGNWSTNAWTSRVPLPHDNVVISSAFIASQIVTVDMPRAGHDITWSNTGSNSVEWAKPTAFSMYGSLTLNTPALMTNTGSSVTITCEGRGAQTWTGNGQTLVNHISQNGPAGTITLQDNWLMSGIYTNFNGAFDCNNKNPEFYATNCANAATSSITLGTGTIKLTGSGWQMYPLSTFSGASATILLSETGTLAKTFAGGGRTYGHLLVSGGGSGAVTITGNNSFIDMAMSGTGSKTIKFPASGTQTLTGGSASGFFSGTAGNVVSCVSSTPGTRWKISSSTAIVSNWLNLTDSDADGTVPFSMGAGGNDLGNNLDWTFAPPVIVRPINGGLVYATQLKGGLIR